MAEKKEVVKEYTVRVDGHTHQGKPAKKGDKIKLSERQVAWLRGLGVV